MTCSAFFVSSATPDAATSQAHDYDFVEANNFGGTVDVVVSDRAGNETIESFVRGQVI